MTPSHGARTRGCYANKREVACEVLALVSDSGFPPHPCGAQASAVRQSCARSDAGGRMGLAMLPNGVTIEPQGRGLTVNEFMQELAQQGGWGFGLGRELGNLRMMMPDGLPVRSVRIADGAVYLSDAEDVLDKLAERIEGDATPEQDT